MDYRKISAAAGYGVQLERLRDQLGLAMVLANQIAGVPVPVRQDQPITEKVIRDILKQRRNRIRFFDEELFADPAWDMLLELYATELGQQRVSVTSLCLAAAVPATTALRWITLLEKKGMIERRADPRDGRRVFVSLSRSALNAIEAYFITVPGGQPVI